MQAPDFIPAGSLVRWACHGYISFTNYWTFDSAVSATVSALESAGSFFEVRNYSHDIWSFNVRDKYALIFELKTTRDYDRITSLDADIVRVVTSMGWTLDMASRSIVLVTRGDGVPRLGTQPGAGTGLPFEVPTTALLLGGGALLLLLLLRD